MRDAGLVGPVTAGWDGRAPETAIGAGARPGPGGSPSPGPIGSGSQTSRMCGSGPIGCPWPSCSTPGHEACRRAPVPRGCLGFECISQACSR